MKYGKYEGGFKLTPNPEKSTFKKPSFIRVKGWNASATTLRWFASDSAYSGDPLSLFFSLSLKRDD